MAELKSIQQEEATSRRFSWKKLLRSRWVVENIPFFLFLAFLAVLYIFNGHFSDKLTRKISTSEKNIKELQYEYKTVKSDVIFRSKASELVKAVEPLGLKELTEPPVVLKDSTENGE